MPRFYCPLPLVRGAELDLPAGAARHVQVLRLQPGDVITLFNSGLAPADSNHPNADQTGEFRATITRMGRSTVQVEVGDHVAVQREPGPMVHLAIGMPANERMDWLVEKATELGVASIQPLMTQRSVLRLSGERADKKVAHWRSIAIAACEQCGGNRVPEIWPVRPLAAWLGALDNPSDTPRWLLSLHDAGSPLQSVARAQAAQSFFLCGPEGGLSLDEEAAAMAAGFSAVTLGPRVLRSETASLAALVRLLG